MNRRHFLGTTLGAGLSLASYVGAAERKLCVAVIGHTGRGNYGHGLDVVWLALPEVELVAVADADSKGLAAALKRLNLAKGYADYRVMLTETKPDIVAIAPRFVDEHRDMALAAITAGARGIYCEKPFCRSPAEADEIVAACEKNNVKFAVAHRNRYHPAIAAVDKLLKEGAIGKLLEMRARGKEDQRGGGLDLWVLGAHLFNLMNYFGGQPLACTATVLQGGKPATRADVQDGAEGVGPLAGNEVHARFELECGVPAFFDSVQNAGDKAAGFGVQLIGTKGVIDFRVDTEPFVHLLPGGALHPQKEPRTWSPISSAGPGQPEPIADLAKQVTSHQLAAQDLLAALRENRTPLCDANAARTTIEMICAVFESHRLGSQRVTFPLKTRENPLTKW
jgi:predicted dehydrogenase